MKIEMGESLMQSYLKYEKGCLVTQTNWKTSSRWQVSDDDSQAVKAVFEKIRAHGEFSEVFKNCSLEQALRQAELDVVGINNDKLYMVEVAFHERGLQYGDKLETRDKIIEKMLRAYLIGLSYFPNFTYEIIFASPKVNPATDSVLKECLAVLEKDFADGENVCFRYLANEQFKEEVLVPTLNSALADSDTSELFVRGAKMLEMYGLLDLAKQKSNKSCYYTKQIGGSDKFNQHPEATQDLVSAEISKVENRLPKWLNNPMQLNSRILYAFLRLYDPTVGYVFYNELERVSNLGKIFSSNFDQMKNFGKKNHGKIFEQDGNRVYLWDKVKDFVLSAYKQSKM